MPLAVSPSLQAAYAEEYAADKSAWRELGGKYKAQNILDVCAGRHFAKVLEVGAGEGSILMHLDRHGFAPELHALEISPSGLERIEDRALPSLKSAELFDGYAIPHDDGAFDLVILSHVLEHVEYPRLLLREIRRVARHLVIEVPCDFSFDVDRHVEHFLSYGHINIYTPTLLRFLLKAEGLTLLRDRLSYTTRDVIEYNWHMNQGMPRTWRTRWGLTKFLLKRRLRLLFANRVKRELLANAYTVLCRSKVFSESFGHIVSVP